MVRVWEEEEETVGKRLVVEEEEVHPVVHPVWEVEEEEAEEEEEEEAHQALNLIPGRRADRYHPWQEVQGERQIVVFLLVCVSTAATCQFSIALSLPIKFRPYHHQ